jgi:hypothetical protein
MVDAAALADDLAQEAGLTDRPDNARQGGPGLMLAGLAVRVVAVGWATVDLDRAWVELGETAAAQPADGARVQDELLGAWARLLGSSSGDIQSVLLEPFTEGRLAASLARRGEGPAVLYVTPAGGDLSAAVDRLAGGGSRVRSGRTALGPGAVVLGGSPGGPQVLLVAVPSGP